MPHEEHSPRDYYKINSLIFKKVINAYRENHIKNLTTLSEQNADFSLLLR